MEACCRIFCRGGENIIGEIYGETGDCSNLWSLREAHLVCKPHVCEYLFLYIILHLDEIDIK